MSWALERAANSHPCLLQVLPAHPERTPSYRLPQGAPSLWGPLHTCPNHPGARYWGPGASPCPIPSLRWLPLRSFPWELQSRLPPSFPFRLPGERAWCFPAWPTMAWRGPRSGSENVTETFSLAALFRPESSPRPQGGRACTGRGCPGLAASLCRSPPGSCLGTRRRSGGGPPCCQRPVCPVPRWPPDLAHTFTAAFELKSPPLQGLRGSASRRDAVWHLGTGQRAAEMTAPLSATSVWFLDPSASSAATGQRAPAAWASASLTLVSWPPGGPALWAGERTPEAGRVTDTLVACAKTVTYSRCMALEGPLLSPWPVGQRTREPQGGETLGDGAHGVGSGPRGRPPPDAGGRGPRWGSGRRARSERRGQSPGLG